MSASSKLIDTAKTSERLRERAIRPSERKVLVSRLGGSEQEPDLSLPCNCNGFGRIRHFRQKTSQGWPSNPLPILPACKALGIAPLPVMTAQVFQNAACAWRCWYCFVPYNLLSADPKRGEWFTAEDLVRLYESETEQPLVIDLSGGSPDLVPEWTPWMMMALADAGLDSKTFLWTDDNLSTTYLFDKLDRSELDRMRSYRNYGRVCCFKGYDARSFAFNTRAAQGDFERQFEIMRRLLELNLDIYGYVTLTAPDDDGVDDAMSRFFDRLQGVHPNLPLRIVPLEIREFAPVTPRLDAIRQKSLEVQQSAIRAWNDQLKRRYSVSQLALDVTSVSLSSRVGVR
jgi:uncharacterized Fe-S cluster-containing radical SAM superfamily protein